MVNAFWHADAAEQGSWFGDDIGSRAGGTLFASRPGLVGACQTEATSDR
jgi:hypothetical protein